MSRRRRDDGDPLSLDSFLDIVTNVVGVLILVAVVTVLSAGDITISTGATALRQPQPAAARILIECARGEVFFVDEKTNATKARAAVEAWQEEVEDPEMDSLFAQFTERDIGDPTHRVFAQLAENGMAWVYALREGARGDARKDVERGRGAFAEMLAEADEDSYVYFVVHDDSFEAFRAARDLAQAKGFATGWHPVEGDTPIRISSIGSLGTRVQ